ncbi:MAG: hypothetical protein V4736_00790 [Bdellovibrionota bacterium]
MSAVKQLSTSYERFQQLDGYHPLQDVVPDSCVLYQVRELGQGRVSYFNFNLAKEMGLIPNSHDQVMTEELHEMLIKTFSLRILNEYDELTRKRTPAKSIKPKKFMATRYLQLQHQSRTGKTSGDGRGIWNGVVKHRGKTWDVSSRGTGVTCLSPGFVQANKPLKTGNTDFGYGCGLAEIDELIGCAIQSEIFHRRGINTERTLCVIDLGGGVGIGVRAGHNLLRPAHLFIYLKQNRHAELRALFNYYMDREKENGNGTYSVKSMIMDFAKFTARLERDYIFTWVAWDGDNLLANAGIIDYGSIRQFGAFHHHYRYDDVDRFSTRLVEQKEQTKNIMLTLLQMTDFIETKNRKKISDFRHHALIKKFNKVYATEVESQMLSSLGFTPAEAKIVQTRFKKQWKQLRTMYKAMEMWHDPKEKKIADGVNKPALLSMRIFLKTLSHWLSFNPGLSEKDCKEILKISTTQKHYATLVSHTDRVVMTQTFISTYQFLIKELGKSSQILGRMSQVHSQTRITGNALIHLVDLISAQNRKRDPLLTQALIDHAVDLGTARIANTAPKELHVKILAITEEYSKEI